MQITNVKLFKSNFADTGYTKAFGQLELDNAIALDIEVCVKSESEQWIRFPGYKKVKDKTTGVEKTQSRVFIKDQTLRETITTEVLSKYNREIAGLTSQPRVTGNVNADTGLNNSASAFPF
jgi:DNA-binding cell septation regulator SpoVG